MIGRFICTDPRRINNQIHAVGRLAFTREEIEAVIARNVALCRQHGGGGSYLFNAMTVQQAKNREFEGVIVIWPYQVWGDVEHRRRLLYNAVTRTKLWYNIIVQSQNILGATSFCLGRNECRSAPFAART